MSYVIKTSNLTKVYNENEVVSNVNMNVKKGEIYGFLGPNGAGKTTVMKMLTNLIKPTAGDIEIFGESLTNISYEVLKRMGAIIEYPVFYNNLTGLENLELHLEYMGYYDKKSINTSLELVNLKNINNKKVKDFSLGMKQRLGIARAILTKPELLILDEPINGLDPVGIKEIRSLFKVLNKEYGITILISSHILAEIELIADTIGVIKSGKLVKEVSLDTIKEETSEYIEVITPDINRAAIILENNHKIPNFKIMDNNTLRVYSSNISHNDISKEFILNDIFIDSINRKNASLEDYFMKILNGGDLNA